MHISNTSIASLFQQLQSAASGNLTSSSFGTQLTGQNLPTITSGGASAFSLAPSPLSSTPSSQFASNILSALLATQQSPPSAQTVAGQIISAINPGGNGSLSLSQVEQSLTGSSATTSPQQQSIANAFTQLTNGSGSLSQSELATALQSLQQQSDPMQGMGGGHHHHHHMEGGSSTTDQASSTTATSSTPTSGSSTDPTTSTDGVTAAVTTPTVSVAA